MIGNLTEAQSRDFLSNQITGRIGCNDGIKTYVVPINYVFDGKVIISHSVEGMKIDIMRLNPNVCFEVDEVKTLNNWQSVIVWGRYQELTDERDRYYAMKLFVNRMMHIKISKTAEHLQREGLEAGLSSSQFKRSVFYRIVMNEMTGKYEKE